MDQRNEIPDPKTTGVFGEQERGEEPQTTYQIIPRHALRDTVMGLTANRPKNFGGDLSATLIGSVVEHITQESIDIKHTLELKNNELRAIIDELSAATVKIAKLEVNLETAIAVSRIKQACIFIGTAVTGISIELFRNNFPISYLIGIFGLALIFLPLLFKIKDRK